MNPRYLGLVLLCALPSLASAQPSGQDVYNQEFARVWRTTLAPPLRQKLEAETRASLQGITQTRGRIQIEVREVHAVEFDIDRPFGFPIIRPDRLVLRFPIQGGWNIRIKVRVRVKMRVGPFRARSTFNVELLIKNLSLGVDLALDTSDPTRPVLQRLAPPQVTFDLEINSSNSLIRLLRRFLNRKMNSLAHQALNDALVSAGPAMVGLQGMPGPIPGDGTTPFVDSGTPSPLTEVVANVDRKLPRDQMPYGITLPTFHATPQTDSYEDAYRNGGPDNLGPVVRFWPGGDSCMWTGHFLAAQAFRYAATGDPDALANVRHTLRGVGNLLAANGDTGLLCRNAAPESSAVGQVIAAGLGTHNRNLVRGQMWITMQGRKGITRDQYSGAIFGLATAHDNVADPAVKAECKRLITMMLDYIIAHGWVVDEDRRAWDVTDRTTAPTVWAGIGYQELAFMQIGERVAPGRYAAELARVGPLAEITWLNAWGGTFGLGHYYKYNLQYINYYSYFRLETDQARWQDMHRALLITHRYVGHHRNPHFDLIQTSVDPGRRAVKFPSVREAMRRFIRRKHRLVAPTVVDLSNVTWDTITLTQYVQDPVTGVTTLVTQSVQVPSEPLTPEIQVLTHHFLWQRNPFEPVPAGSGDAQWETLGVSLSLPYWMGRDQGAF